MKRSNEQGRSRALVYFVALALMAAVLATTGGSLASYISSVSGSDGARVAKWDVEITEAAEQSHELKLKKGQIEQDYAFNVVSDSEVTVCYDVIMTLPQALPTDIDVTLDGAQAAVSDSGRVYTFSAINTLPAGSSQTAQHTLKFRILASKIYDRGDNGYPVINNIGISVHAYQVD